MIGRIFRLIKKPSLLFLFTFFLLLGSQNRIADTRHRIDYELVVQNLEMLIDHEMADKQLPAFSISLVAGKDIIWTRGFGMADPDKKIPATAETVYRIGSVSKLFTDIAVMQLVERGKLNLDVPVDTYLPNFRPENPFKEHITLRQLMGHCSGLTREPPVGNYFDPSEPSLARTVESLNSTELVYEPGTKTKYSNAGIAVVGYILESTQGKPFSQYLKQSVIVPMGLKKSSFEPEPLIKKDLAKAFMWTYDGRVFKAPVFELGMSPAGCMYSTVTDLARFLIVLFNGGKGPEGHVLKPETLEEMWKPQFAPPGQNQGFGIGFFISELNGHRLVKHNGAIYGFSTTLAALPEQRLGVAAVATMDATNSVVERISNYALKLLLACQDNKPLPKARLSSPLDPALARKLEGNYVCGERKIELVERRGRLFLRRREMLLELKSLNKKLVVDDRLSFGPEIEVQAGQLKIGNLIFNREDVSKPEPAPERWKGLIGEYGWDHNILYILEKDGQLRALIEWFFSYPLKEISASVFAFPDYGLYHGENLVFERDKEGNAVQVKVGNVIFKRRPVGLDKGKTFTIVPVKPVEVLREVALRSQPPKEEGRFLKPDLVDISTLDPTIKFNIIYATNNNFMQAVFYEQPKAFMQRPAAEALLRAHKRLKKLGYGLLITDAYRPWYVTKMFWDATPEDKKIFVADPSKGSRHNRGCAVDLTMYDLKTGVPVNMVSGIDEMSGRSNAYYMGGTSLQRWHRDLLRMLWKKKDLLSTLLNGGILITRNGRNIRF